MFYGALQGVVRGIVFRTKSDVCVEKQPSEASILSHGSVCLIVVCPQSPALHIVLGPVCIIDIDFSDIVIQEIVYIHHGAELLIVCRNVKIVVCGKIYHGVIGVKIAFIRHHAIFYQVQIVAIHTVNPGQIVFVKAFPDVEHTPILTV